MLRKLLIAFALAGFLVSAATASTSTRAGLLQPGESSSVLMPGVAYTREVDFTPRGPVVLDVVTAPQPDGSVYTLAPVLSNDRVLGTETLTSIERRLSPTATTVGIDGDFFSTANGHPSGLLMRGGVLDTMPAPARSSLGIATDGTLSVARVLFKGTWQGTGQRRPLDLDAIPAKGHTTLYTPAWGATTPAEAGVVETVFDSFPATAAGRPLTATVSRVTTAGPTPIPPGGAVLVGRGQQAQFLSAEAPPRAAVEVRLTLTPDWSGMAAASGGGPLLVADGKPVFDAGESFAPGVVNNRYARGAVGQLADGRILLVTVEGGHGAYSVGMTSHELAVALARLGAVTAIGLGSGGPAAMAFDGTLLTRPSGSAEQPIADALVLSYTGVYAAPPATATLSPNGDGVDDVETFSYKLVRPAHVVASLAGPGSAIRTLVAEDDPPGVHTLQWDGTLADGTAAPEGKWRFIVTATDDRGTATAAERDFTLDDTLGSLAVAPVAHGAATATYRLTRTASVVVTVRRRNGVVVATLQRGVLGPGSHSVRWSGNGLGGKPARNGVYQIRVEATSGLGTVSLAAPFTFSSRRHS